MSVQSKEETKLNAVKLLLRHNVDVIVYPTDELLDKYTQAIVIFTKPNTEE